MAITAYCLLYSAYWFTDSDNHLNFRRGDIILFTENACDIMYLEEMYSRKIRELYEQQIKTVDDLNKSILFYGSKTPVR